MPFVSFMDWYNMSWPSTVRFAMVKTLLACSLLEAASVERRSSKIWRYIRQWRDPIRIQTRLQEELLQKWKCFRTMPLLPELRWQSLTWNCDSLSLGMSFHVARNTCRSADTKSAHQKQIWDNRKVLIKKMQNMAAMWKTHSYKCKIWGVGWGCTLLLNHRCTSGGQTCSCCFWMLDQIKAASWWIIPAERRRFVGIVMRQSRCFTNWNRNKPPKCTWCVLCAGNCVAKSNEQARRGRRSLARTSTLKFTRRS